MKLRNTVTGKFFVKGDGFIHSVEDGEVFSKGDEAIVALIKSTYENVEVYDLIPRKVNSYKGETFYKYLGRSIYVKRRTEYDRRSGKSRSYSILTIDGNIVTGSGIRDAKKLIDSK